MTRDPKWIVAEAHVRSWIEGCRAFRPEVEAVAGHLLRSFASVSKPQPTVDLFDLVNIARWFGYEVRFEEFRNSLRRFRAYTDFLDKVIHLNKGTLGGTDALARAAFELAHELGHVALHPYHHAVADDSLATTESLIRYLQEEWLANYFAGALLMDRHSFVDCLKRHRYDLRQVSKEFGVTCHAAAHRAVVVSGAEEGAALRLVQVAKDDFGFIRVVKSYATDPSVFPAPAVGSLACRKWAVSIALDQSPAPEPVRQFSILKRGSSYEKVFVVAWSEGNDERRPSAVSLGWGMKHLGFIDGAYSNVEEVHVGTGCVASCPWLERECPSKDEVASDLAREDRLRGFPPLGTLPALVP